MLKNLPNTVNIPSLGIKTAIAENIPVKVKKQPPQKPKKPGKVLVAGKASIVIDDCNLSLRSVKDGVAVIDVTKPNMAISRLEKLKTGSMVRFSTADKQYFVSVSEVGKNFVRISVRKG